MRKLLISLFVISAITIALVIGNAFHALQAQGQVQTQAKQGAGFGAIPGTKGGQDIFGAYEVVKGWPKDISTIPGNEKWTYGAGQSVYAENPNRVFMLFRGELPNIKRPQSKRSEEHTSELQ